MEKHILVKGILLLLWIWLCSEALSIVAAKHNGEASKMEMGLGVVPRVWKEKRGMQREHLRACKNMVLYFHDILYNGKNAHNATSAIVAAPQGANLTALSSSNNHFGDMVVFDDPITPDNNLHSPPVGRAQGFYFYDMKSTFSAWFGFAFVLNHTDFFKGTLTFGGADPTLTKYRDISVVGGTGDFLMARGIATFSTDSVEDDVYFRVRVNITLYECY